MELFELGLYQFVIPFVSVHEGEEGGSGADDPGSGEGAGAAEPAEKPTVTTNSELPKSFSQDEVNTLLAKEKREWQEKNKKALSELEQVRKNFAGTKEEKERLEKQIEQIRLDSMTAEERANAEKERLRKEAEGAKKELEADRDLWMNRYTDSTIARALTDAAVEEKAITPEPILAILRSNTRLMPVIDKESGKETGELVPKTRLKTVNDKKEPVTLDLSPREAVAKMKEERRYQHLFAGDKNSGLGGNQATGASDDIEDVKRMNPEQYRKEGRKRALRR